MSEKSAFTFHHNFYPKPKVKLEDAKISDKTKDKLQVLKQNYNDIFSQHSTDTGLAHLEEIVFCLKDAHAIIQCDHSPLCKYIYSVMKNDKVNNWSQEIHALTPYIEFEHIKVKENILADSLSKLKPLGLYEANTPEKEGHEYGKSIF